jgi:hypothetical protein
VHTFGFSTMGICTQGNLACGEWPSVFPIQK